MPIYKPFGIFYDESIDRNRLKKEYTEAKNIIEDTTSWQWVSSQQSGLNYDSIAKNGSGVIVEQRQRAGYLDTKGNMEARNIMAGSLSLDDGLAPWYIPYLRGWHDVWNGELNIEWTSNTAELVLVGYSFFAYRLSSKNESDHWKRGQYWFADHVQPRMKFGVRVDGSVTEGSGCGTNDSTNGPEMVWGNGSRQKAIVSSSNSVHMLGAGQHLVAPVAGQGPANETDSDYYYRTNEILSSPGEGLNGPNHGVVMVNARLNIIRFPRGQKLGG
tara:strand:+ start:3859 stop:4674 length:816 start_codon:yes stop_codon:yes gene_type:complete